jgi:predicted NAD/FAD-binding protein
MLEAICTDWDRWTHRLLTALDTSPQWRTLKYGAHSYIDTVLKGFPSNHLFHNTPVQSISSNDNDQVVLHLADGQTKTYDHVIVAVHGDQAYSLVLQDSNYEERRILSEFSTSKCTAVLHSDVSLMPRSRKAWSACNYIATSAVSPTGADQACITYNMNLLQRIPEEAFGPIFVTLNPIHQPDPALVQGRFVYAHPLHNSATVRAQKLLPRIQNTRGISYCGAWTRHGFHEDGFSSGLRVAQDHLGAKLPFELKDGTFSPGQRRILGLVGLLVKVGIVLLQILITVVERLFVAQRARRQQLEVHAKKWM